MPETVFILLLSIGLVGLFSIPERPSTFTIGLSIRNLKPLYKLLKGDRINYYFRTLVVLILVVVACAISSLAFADKFTDTIDIYIK